MTTYQKLVKFLLCLIPTFAISSALAASFDCSKASTKIEKTICENKVISKLDDDLASIYKQALKREPATTRDDQRAWVKNRNACSDEQCLKQSYEKRIAELYEFVRAVDKELRYVERASQEEKNNKVELTQQEKKWVSEIHTSAMCAGFYSRYLPGASESSCMREDINSQLACRAWATKNIFDSNLRARKAPANLKSYIDSNKSEFNGSYDLGKQSFASNDTSLKCKQFLDYMSSK